jgi:pilus assembly protein CpaE
LPKLDGFSVARRIRNTSITRHVAILMLTARGQISDKVSGFEAGADDYLTKPFDPSELELRIRTLLARTAPTSEADTGGRRGKVISLFSLRGGVGKTSLAVNLAVTLAQLWNEPVPLFDLALQNGQAAIFLGLHPKATLDDLIEHWQEYPDADSLNEFFTVRDNLVRLLAAPHHPASAERVSADMLKHLIRLVRSRYPFLIADLSSRLDDTMLAVLDSSDLILLMMAPEVASVHSVIETLDTFSALEYPKQKVCLVLCQTFARRALTPGQIESAIGVSLGLVIPHEPELITHAINTGEPYVLMNSNGAAARVIQDYAYYLGQPEIVEEAELTPLARSVRSRVRGKPQ